MTKLEYESLKQLYVVQEDNSEFPIDSFNLSALIQDTSSSEIFDIIKSEKDNLISITSKNIPQFSNIDDIYKVLRIVIDSEIKDLDYRDIGFYLTGKSAKSGAQTKYGENHYKIAAQLGLVTNEKPYSATDLGMVYYLTDSVDVRMSIVKKLTFRIPVLQRALIEADAGSTNLKNIMSEFLSESTVKRRLTNVKTLLSLMYEISDIRLKQIINRIYW